MARSYTDELAEWVKRRDASRPRQDRHVVAFLAARTDVKAAMDAGYALKTIWAHLHEAGRLPYRYETFLKHVRRHIKQAPDPAPTKAGNARPAGWAAKAELTKDRPSVGGFTFNATPNKEDLI